MSKKVLITGGPGFIGHHLIDLLLTKTDWDIVSLDRLDFSGNLNRLHEVAQGYPINVQKRLKVVFHDLKAEINPLVSSFIGKPDIILHLAAASHVDRSITHPMEFIHDNIVGTAHLLEYARKLDNLETFLYFGTDEIFGAAPEGVNYSERDRYNSTNPYSASKAASEELCVAWENTYRMPMMITHTMNAFGERQTPEKFIPLCIDKIDKGEKIFIHSNTERTKAGSRFYIHAADIADAIHFLITTKPYVAPDFGGARVPKFNIVGKEEVDNLTLAQMIATSQNKELIYEMLDFHTSRPGHDMRYALSGNLMKSLGWEPKISLTERISQVSKWYLQNDRWLGR
ncbi:GDP-mannose 4,6-dehydratase [Candidatus Dojkabacteria bacterium]|jgi:dTDP-glucose 4,6-dehydratase|nr:GDP-mannose 4,6-dehydratase [Candidatus Dojkabacteria bacterium]